MNIKTVRCQVWISSIVLGCLVSAPVLSAEKASPRPASTTTVRTFATAEQAMDALVAAAEAFDVDAIARIFGPAGKEILVTAEPPHDRAIAQTFAKLAREKKSVAIDPRNSNHAVILVGPEDWPFAVPLVRKNGTWSFDTAAGIVELSYRRVGANELDVIDLLHGYVEAQQAYALQKRDGSGVNRYAERIISTPGKQDGLAWQTADGQWEGPIGENVANAIDKGYAEGQPYHGYYFKVLTPQWPVAALGAMDYVIAGAIGGGFALVAAPAEYAVTGVKTFIVGSDGVVYEKDFGDATLDEFKKMERFNPGETWTPIGK